MLSGSDLIQTYKDRTRSAAVKMVFVKEESEEDMSEPEPWRIKHEEQGGRWSHMPIYKVLFLGCTNVFPSLHSRAMQALLGRFQCFFFFFPLMFVIYTI